MTLICPDMSLICPGELHPFWERAAAECSGCCLARRLWQRFSTVCAARISSMCMYIHTYIHTCVCIYICMCMYRYVEICIEMQTYVCACIVMHVHVQICIDIYRYMYRYIYSQAVVAVLLDALGKDSQQFVRMCIYVCIHAYTSV